MIRISKQANVQKFVDKYFLPHFYHHLQKQHYSHGGKNSKSNSCNLCAKIADAAVEDQSKKRELFLNQDDIDLLQLMDPKNTPEVYMKNLLKLYKNQENLRQREQKNEPMQLTLTTRKIFHTKNNLDNHSQPLDFTQLEQGIDDKQQTRQQQLDRAQIAKMREECFLRLGKMIVCRKQTQNRCELSKSNYQTMQYQLPRVREQVDRLSMLNNERGIKKFYLIASANSRGINFQVDKMPPMLSQVLQFNKFRQIMCTLNEIIQQTVYQRRSETTRNKRINSLYFWQWLILLAIISILIINTLTVNLNILTITSLIASLCLIVFILMNSCHRFREQIAYISLIDALNIKITDYLNYLNSQPQANLYWKTADHLYWIQITVISSN